LEELLRQHTQLLQDEDTPIPDIPENNIETQANPNEEEKDGQTSPQWFQKLKAHELKEAVENALEAERWIWRKRKVHESWNPEEDEERQRNGPGEETDQENGEETDLFQHDQNGSQITAKPANPMTQERTQTASFEQLWKTYEKTAKLLTVTVDQLFDIKHCGELVDDFLRESTRLRNAMIEKQHMIEDTVATGVTDKEYECCRGSCRVLIEKLEAIESLTYFSRKFHPVLHSIMGLHASKLERFLILTRTQDVSQKVIVDLASIEGALQKVSLKSCSPSRESSQLDEIYQRKTPFGLAEQMELRKLRPQRSGTESIDSGYFSQIEGKARPRSARSSMDSVIQELY